MTFVEKKLEKITSILFKSSYTESRMWFRFVKPFFLRYFELRSTHASTTTSTSSAKETFLGLLGAADTKNHSVARQFYLCF